LLHNAQLITEGVQKTFAALYAEWVEARHANPFIAQLWQMKDLQKESTCLRAIVAQSIVRDLTRSGLVDPAVPDSRVFLAYCLYWWSSFARGYAFEAWVLRDLQDSGILVEAHDLAHPADRFSPYDLGVLDFRGDIKTSTYFLMVARSNTLQHDFYITRLLGRTMVVMLKDAFWEEIDGDTVFVPLKQVVSVFPRAARVGTRSGELVVLDYQVWKERVRAKQQEHSNEDD
jgi:hypothetical protein